jgi:tRNA-dihydrouridine synthase C
MEGVLDPLMRDLLTQLNPYDLCITEFIRIVDSLLPERVFHRVNPELAHNGYTPSKTPIRVQLLGQHPQWMAENAVRAITLGSHGVDINFGCPAKAVNKSRGGAVLLKSPKDIYQITKAVKDAVGEENIVSVKIRLGFEDTSLFEEIIDAIDQAKADHITIHARTKKHGYKPPAYWDFIARAHEKTDINIIANGEIWNRADALNCIKTSTSSHLMIGRGALALPNLADVIKNNAAPMSWQQMCLLLKKYSMLELEGNKSFYFSSRLKQWLRYLRLQYPEAELLFQKIKRLKDKDEIMSLIGH